MQTYILIAVVALAIIVAGIFLAKKKTQKPISKLAGIAFLFIIAGIVFGGDKLTGYGLIGVGLILAAVDIVKKSKRH